jgi:hypothetical protein
MAGSTTPTSSTQRAAARRRYGATDNRPRPLRQGLWLLATVAIAGVILLNGPDRIGDQPLEFDLGPETLLELAEARETDPAAPSAERPAGDEATDGLTPAPLAATDRSTADGSNDTTAATEEARAGAEALQLISYPWEQLLPGWTVEFLPERDGLYGLTKVRHQRIEIYVRLDRSPTFLAHVIAHELGHAVDVTLNDEDDRDRWRAARGLDSAPWWPESGKTDFQTGAGDFAESFAAWQINADNFRSELGTAPTATQTELLAELGSS